MKIGIIQISIIHLRYLFMKTLTALDTPKTYCFHKVFRILVKDGIMLTLIQIYLLLLDKIFLFPIKSLMAQEIYMQMKIRIIYQIDLMSEMVAMVLITYLYHMAISPLDHGLKVMLLLVLFQVMLIKILNQRLEMLFY